MNRVLLSVMIFFFGLTGIAGAALIDRGGGLIYDTELNITWLQDANISGQMTWTQAMNWAGNLEYYDSVRNVTWTEWRLPQILPINGTSYNYNYLFDGTSDKGYNISAPGSTYSGNTGSEMAYMFYNNLGNKGYCDFTGEGGQPGWGLKNTGPFINLQPDLYWSSLVYNIIDPNMAFYFNFNGGDQSGNYLDRYYYAWAVRDGDVTPVPIPGAIWLFGSGLAGIIGFKKLKRNRQS